MNKFLILGAGGHSRSVAEVILSNPRNRIIGFLDDTKAKGTSVLNQFEVLGAIDAIDDFTRNATLLAMGIGGIWPLNYRDEIFLNLHEKGFEFPSLIHQFSSVFDSEKIGKGSQIHPGAIVRAGATIGRNCIINSGAIIEHDVVIGDSCIVSPGATICGNTTLGRGSFLGANSTIIQNLNIGPSTFVAAGAVVTKNFTPGVFLKGVPARIYEDF